MIAPPPIAPPCTHRDATTGIAGGREGAGAADVGAASVVLADAHGNAITAVADREGAGAADVETIPNVTGRA
jgi:hypothetical protein